VRRALLIAALSLTACARGEVGSLGLLGAADAGGGGVDAGGGRDGGAVADAGAVRCEDLSEAACAASNCLEKRCPGCFGQDFFGGCWGEGPEPSCPDVDCPPDCSGLSEPACHAAGGACRADYCPGCRTPDTFMGCARPTDPPPGCPPVYCPPCESLGEEECAADPGCHRVFEGSELCGCPTPGCCHHFARCAEGAQAYCRDDNLSCRRVQPFCEGPYVVSYEGFCYEGCALATDCAP
jgi:hypothetical protein